MLSPLPSILDPPHTGNYKVGDNKKLEKKRWEVKIKLSQYNPRRAKQIITEVRILILINLIRIDPYSDASYVMKKDTMLENVLRTKMSLTRRRK